MFSLCFKIFAREGLGDVLLRSGSDAIFKEITSAGAEVIKSELSAVSKFRRIDDSTELYIEGDGMKDPLVYDEATKKILSRLFFMVNEMLKGNMEYVDNVVFSGPPGGGKTRIMITLVRYIIRRAATINARKGYTKQSFIKKLFSKNKSKKVKAFIFPGSYFSQYEDQKAVGISKCPL